MRLSLCLRSALFLVLACLAIGAFGAEIAGRWKTRVGGPDGMELVYSFKTEGEKLTGTVDSPMGAQELRDGKIAGLSFSFAVPFDDLLIQYKCKLVSDDEVMVDLIGFGDGITMKLTRMKPGEVITPSAPPPTAVEAPRTHVWWKDGNPGQRPYTKDAKKLPLISVQGNHFVDPSGATVLFRGLCIADPDKIEMQGHWNKELFTKVSEMGTKLVRIPVHPVAWRERSPAAYIRLLDQAVDWCTELGMYVMIDWHSIGNLETEVFQDSMYDTTKAETFRFWRAMSRHFAGHNTVAFFELFNEPTTLRNQLGPVVWSTWKKTVEEEIALIRGANPQVIPVVAGFDWAYDLTPVRQEPIAAERIAYSTHPYSNKRSQPWADKWELDFGFVADKYPVIATEFGGFPKAAQGVDPASVKNANYGPEIIKYLERKGISWTVWCFDPEWGPTLIKNWNYELSASGEFARSAMHGEVK